MICITLFKAVECFGWIDNAFRYCFIASPVLPVINERNVKKLIKRRKV